MKYFKLLFILLFISGQFLFAQEVKDISVHLKMLEKKNHSAPEIYGKTILFSYKPEKYTRFVGIAFEHESYREIHTFRKNKFNVFVLNYLVNTDNNRINYRIIIDGLWMKDPNNSNFFKDRNGIEISYLNLNNYKRNLYIESPSIDKSMATFHLKAKENQNIYLSGDFNNWDPFMYKLKEVSPGEYYLSLHVSAGAHSYYYLINGEIIADPNNPVKRISREGFEISYFNIK